MPYLSKLRKGHTGLNQTKNPQGKNPSLKRTYSIKPHNMYGPKRKIWL